MHDNGLAVADVSMVHPAAATYVRQASGTMGEAVVAGDAEQRAMYGGGGEFVPLSTESYGRLGIPAMKFLDDFSCGRVRCHQGGVHFGCHA
jgi:hypothetical protein